MRIIALPLFLFLLLLLLLLLITPPSFVNAEIYKTIDKHGNVVFTDKPSPDQPSEPVTLKPATRLHLPPSTSGSVNQPANSTASEEPAYSMFEINSPVHDSTVRNNGNFTIKVDIRPSLAKGHRLRFYIDGQVVTGPQRLLTHNVKNMDRGTHQLKVEILNSSGKVVQKAESTVHVQRTIYRPPPPPSSS